MHQKHNRHQKDQKRVRKSRLSVYEVSQIAVEKGIKTRLEFLVLAKSQKDEEKTDLAEFIANRGLKNLDEAISIGWEMENAPFDFRKNTPVEIGDSD